MSYGILIDFGSTFTKVVIVDLVSKEIVLTDKVPSTVNTDASICLNQCFELSKKVLGEADFKQAEKLASSSAAGGLRMSVVGLTNSLSTLAGKSAALSAGARITSSFSGILTEDSINELEKGGTEIILFCGGYEHGNVSMVARNAEILAGSNLSVPIIYSGNSELVRDIRRIMQVHKKQCYIAPNIIPRQGVLNPEPTQCIIKSIFFDYIMDMKGLHNIKNEFSNRLIPTPAALLSAGELLSRGTDIYEGLGPLMIIDIGGATTDVYSIGENKSCDGAKPIGSSEPFLKRTVEGDLGMRESCHSAMGECGIGSAALRLDITESQLRNAIRHRAEKTDYLPDNETERMIDDMIAISSASAAVRRHAGRIIPSYNRDGKSIQQGKNLTDFSRIIGTGGILVHNHNPSRILKSAEKNVRDKNILLPESVDTYLDKDYILFSSGLMRMIDEDIAMNMMLKSIRKC